MSTTGKDADKQTRVVTSDEVANPSVAAANSTPGSSAAGTGENGAKQMAAGTQGVAQRPGVATKRAAPKQGAPAAKRTPTPKIPTTGAAPRPPAVPRPSQGLPAVKKASPANPSTGVSKGQAKPTPAKAPIGAAPKSPSSSASPKIAKGTSQPAVNSSAAAAKAKANASDNDEGEELPHLEEGTKVGGYELIRELGRGGMGQVFLARDVKLGRKVAIKFLLKKSGNFTQRFLVEARATAQCVHENIIVIHAVDEYNGMPYMVLEYLEGETLRALCKRGAIRPERAIDLVIPVVRALERAHGMNIVHRDLKRDNIFISKTGSVKVLDFGIAKLFSEGEDSDAGNPTTLLLDDPENTELTQAGNFVGTLTCMSPEQWGVDEVDHRSDIWAVGIALWSMVAQAHPLGRGKAKDLYRFAHNLEEPVPSFAGGAPHAPLELVRIVDKCLAKRKSERYATASALLEDLESLQPGRYSRRMRVGESPFPGMTAFQESDANRFFGRSREVAKAVSSLRENPLLAVMGPSGVGKSSFVRAGVVPALRASGEEWDVLILRPGRQPLQSLATTLNPVAGTTTGTHLRLGTDVGSASGTTNRNNDYETFLEKIRDQPGYVGELLRSRARETGRRILIFIDQFEELYTLGSPEDRAVFTAALTGVADDPSTPLRVMLSMRADFLDRVAEDRRFMEELSKSLFVLAPPDRDSLKEAITEPVELLGYRYEDTAVIEDMLDALASSQGALPLLQFAAARLWDVRDQENKILPSQAYWDMGGVAGALATHADQVIEKLPQSSRPLVRALFSRLVTAEGTRAIVLASDLAELGDSETMLSLVDRLVQARLLVVQNKGKEGIAVEIVHESLLASWPTLRRWLDANEGHTAFQNELRSAATQWHKNGRSDGLLWRGEAADNAAVFQKDFQGVLAQREIDFLEAVFKLATRNVRRRRFALIGGSVVAAVAVVGLAFGLITVSGHKRDADKQAVVAKEQAEIAKMETERARLAEATIAEKLAELKKTQEAKQRSDAMVEESAAELKVALGKAQDAEKTAVEQAKRAQTAMETAKKAKADAEKLYMKEKKRSAELQRRVGKYVNSLK